MERWTYSTWIATAHHESGLPVHLSLTLPQVCRAGTQPAALRDSLQAFFQQTYLDKGRHEALLPHLLPLAAGAQPEIRSLRFSLPAAPRQPALEARFWAVSWPLPSGEWAGYLPTLGVEAIAPTADVLLTRLTEAAQLEFLRKGRLHAIPHLLETQWFETLELHPLPLTLQTYTPSELREMATAPSRSLLAQVAQEMEGLGERLFGLEEAYAQVLAALQPPQRNSVLLIGAPGRGKTALLRWLCQQRAALRLGEARIWEVTAAQLLHRLTESDGWQNQLGLLCQELRRTGDLLYIPDLPELFEVGQYAGNSLSMGDFLRPYLARGEIILLSECTPEAANRLDLRAPGFLSHFSRIELATPSADSLASIVTQKARYLAQRQGVSLAPGLVSEALRLHQWFTPYSGLPGKTLHLLQALITAQATSDDPARPIEPADLYAYFAQDTGLPRFIIDPGSDLDPEAVAATFRREVFGQAAAIDTLVDLIVAIKAAVIRRGKPLASLLFAGPTGVGKTEMAKVLAQFLFGSRDRMLRFDMSEYQDLPALQRLTGDDGRGEGLLTAAVRHQPFSVVLFDELEKAHPLFYDLLLQITGEGRLTSATGRVADFCSTLIIMTSNIGTERFQTGQAGFDQLHSPPAEAAAHFERAVQAHFRPELFNRLDRVLAFTPLPEAVLQQITGREIALIQSREGLQQRPLHLEVSPAAQAWLGQTGYHPQYGARYLQRTIRQHLLIPLARLLNGYPASMPLRVAVERGETGLVLTAETGRPEAPTQSENPYLGWATRHRREIARLQAGQLYTRLLNELDDLHAQLLRLRKRGREAEFWRRQEDVQRHALLEGLLTRTRQLAAEVQALELARLREAGEHRSLPPDAEAHVQVQIWQSHYMALCRELVHAAYPHYDTVTIALYGEEDSLLHLESVYRSLASPHGWEVSTTYVWHDAQQPESPYGRTTSRPPAGKPLCGLLLHLSGPLVFLYFQDEKGLHQRERADGQTTRIWVQVKAVKPDAYVVPTGVHRQEYFRQEKPRRIFKDRGGIQDTEWDIAEPNLRLRNWLQSHLPTHFALTLRQLLLAP